jgi:hypothetical protein
VRFEITGLAQAAGPFHGRLSDRFVLAERSVIPSEFFGLTECVKIPPFAAVARGILSNSATGHIERGT